MAPLDARSPETMGPVRTFVPETRDGAGQAAIEAYRRDGVICLHGAMGEDWLGVIEDAIDLFQAGQAERDDHNVIVRGDGDDGVFQYSSMMWRHNPLFRSVIFESHAADLFGSVLETRQLNFYYDFLLIKNPGCRSASTPWHQDMSYYALHGTQIINCWIALDDIPLDTALRFVRGSHGTGEIFRSVHFDPERAYDGPMEERRLPPDFDRDGGTDIVTCAMTRGDALVWNARTFHSAPGNHLDRRRAALSLNFAGDDVTYFDMPGESDPPDRGEGLVEGGPITCETFPLLRPRQAVPNGPVRT